MSVYAHLSCSHESLLSGNSYIPRRSACILEALAGGLDAFITTGGGPVTFQPGTLRSIEALPKDKVPEKLLKVPWVACLPGLD